VLLPEGYAALEEDLYGADDDPPKVRKRATSSSVATLVRRSSKGWSKDGALPSNSGYSNAV
jgi:hypothetical protein